ncbi:MAG: hypothetical protein WCC94_03275 [Candidatus Bathyarchaeia archaeon]
MHWINPHYLVREKEDGDYESLTVYLSSSPHDCLFGSTVETVDSENERVSFRFPGPSHGLAPSILTDGDRLNYIAEGEPLPFDQKIASFNRAGHIYTLGRSFKGRYYVHCKLNETHGFYAEF